MPALDAGFLLPTVSGCVCVVTHREPGECAEQPSANSQRLTKSHNIKLQNTNNSQRGNPPLPPGGRPIYVARKDMRHM